MTSRAATRSDDPRRGANANASDEVVAETPVRMITRTEGDVTVIEDLPERIQGRPEGGSPTNAAVPVEGTRRRRGSNLGRVTRLAMSVTLASAYSSAFLVAFPIADVTVAPADVSATTEALILAVAVSTWLVILAAFHLFSWERMLTGETLKRALGATATLVGAGAFAGAGRLTVLSNYRFSVAASLVFVLTVLARGGWASVLNHLRARGRIGLRALVIGHNDEPRDLIGLLSADGSDLQPVARILIDGDPPPSDGLPMLAPLGTIDSAIEAFAVDCLVVASQSVSGDELARIRRTARQRGLQMLIITRAPETLTSRIAVRAFGPVVAVALRPARLTGPQALAKRGLDVVIATTALVLALPLMVVLAASIRLTSPGPILFRQVRVTKGGRPFTIYKFRTMIHDVDRVVRDKALDDSQPFFKPQVVDLLTPVGAFMRRLSLDELPQLWNAVRGDMSLVGPRPLPLQQVEANPELLSARHEVGAGITGWWQVNGRSDVSPEDAIRKDIFYIENWSIGLDLSILLKTIGVLVRRRGAY